MMKNKRLLLVIVVILCVVATLLLLFKKNVIFSDTDVLMLKDKIQIPHEDSYIELTNFKLEDGIVKIDLISPLGNMSNWKELNLFINSQEYPIKTNVVGFVTAEESLNKITIMGEVDMEELLNESNHIYIITPYEKIEISYIKKNKLYY